MVHICEDIMRCLGRTSSVWSGVECRVTICKLIRMAGKCLCWHNLDVLFGFYVGHTHMALPHILRVIVIVSDTSTSVGHIEHNTTEYCCFIYYSQAFDCVNFELMWRSLLSFGIPNYLVACLKDIYQNQTAKVETAVDRTGPLSVLRGVRQGCPLSPMLKLFNLYSEHIMRHALEKREYGIEIGGTYYNKLIYAGDVAFLATTEVNL